MAEPKTNIVITIGRQFGSAGLAIGQQVAKDLGLKLYDKRIVDELTKAPSEPEDNPDTMKKSTDKIPNSFLYSLAMDTATGKYVDLPINHKKFIAQTDTIKKLAEDGSCVLVGRCADYALADNPNVISFFIHASMDARIRRIARLYDVTDSKAHDMILDRDTKRHNYYNYYSNKKWGAAESYHICLDSSILGVEGTVEIIKKLVALKENHAENKL